MKKKMYNWHQIKWLSSKKKNEFKLQKVVILQGKSSDFSKLI